MQTRSRTVYFDTVGVATEYGCPAKVEQFYCMHPRWLLLAALFVTCFYASAEEGQIMANSIDDMKKKKKTRSMYLELISDTM